MSADLHSNADADTKTQTASNAALIAAIGAAFLSVIKLFLFMFSGSLIIALSAWDSAMDTIVSLINRKIVKFARIDADENHPYGHGRAESIASLGQGCLILGGAIAIIVSAINSLINLYKVNIWQKTSFSFYYVIFFIFCAIITLFITRWLEKKGRELNSPALLSDSQHYRVDLLTNISSALGICLIVFLSYSFIGPVIAILFSLYIIFSAFKLIIGSIHELMDHDISDEVKKQAFALVMKSNPNVIDIHNFRGRKSGHRYFFDFHVTLPYQLSFNEVHEIIEKIEYDLFLNFDGDVIVHPDPSNIRQNESHD